MAFNERRTLGILLSRGPESPDAAVAVGLAIAAAGQGLEVELFLMSDGARLIAGPAVLSLDRPGLEVAVCSQSVAEQGLPTDVPQVDYASQFQLARSVARSDRFVSFS